MQTLVRPLPGQDFDHPLGGHFAPLGLWFLFTQGGHFQSQCIHAKCPKQLSQDI